MRRYTKEMRETHSVYLCRNPKGDSKEIADRKVIEAAKKRARKAKR